MSNDRSTVPIDEHAAKLFPEQTLADIESIKPQPKTAHEKSEQSLLETLYPAQASLVRKKEESDKAAAAEQAKEIEQKLTGKAKEAEGDAEDREAKDSKAKDGEAETIEGLSEEAQELFQGVEVPEGYELIGNQAEAFAEVASELGLDSKAAAALVKFDAQRQAEMLAQQEQAATDQIEQWNEELQENFTEADLDLALEAFETVGTSELGELLEVTGLGSHPAVVGFVVEVGKVLNGQRGSHVNRALSRAAKERR